MDCPNHSLLAGYHSDELSAVEKMMIRDHLVVCPKCRSIISDYKIMENALREPVLLEPAIDIERIVMKTVSPKTPSKLSLGVLLLFSLSLFIALLYVSFDLSNNGVLAALQVGNANASSILGSLIRLLSGAFKLIYAFYKIVDAFSRALTFGLMSIEMLLLVLSVPSIFIAKSIFRKRDARSHVGK